MFWHLHLDSCPWAHKVLLQIRQACQKAWSGDLTAWSRTKQRFNMADDKEKGRQRGPHVRSSVSVYSLCLKVALNGFCFVSSVMRHSFN